MKKPAIEDVWIITRRNAAIHAFELKLEQQERSELEEQVKRTVRYTGGVLFPAVVKAEIKVTSPSVDHDPAHHHRPGNLAAETTPSSGATYVLYLCLPKEQRDSLIGDLLEEYAEDVLPRFGRRRANFWFWKQAVWSAKFILPAGLTRIAGLGWLVDKVWRLIVHR